MRASLVRLAPFVAFAILGACGGSTPAPVDMQARHPAPTVTATASTPPATVTTATSPQVAALIPAPPVSLTASDGTGLVLTELKARAVVEEPLAFTEMHLAFENPQARVLEGTFKITLPQGATVSRFAMKIGQEWQEGEVVELQAARAAYEDFLHRKQDPALLEQAAGNEFTARVFPIPANGKKEIILSYSQELLQHASYTLPLRGLPELGALDVEVSVSGANLPAAALKRAHATPTADFVLDPQLLKGGPGLRSDNLVLARVTPAAVTQADPITSAIVLFDTSASRALGFADQLRILQNVARGPAGAAQITVACFDQNVDMVYEGNGAGFGEAALDKIRARQALGASDLASALSWARQRAKATGAKRVILISDGVATAGSTESDKLAAAAKSLGEGGVERLDAVAVGGIRDDAGMRKLATVGLARDGVVVDAKADAAQLARRLTLGTKSGIAVNVEGAKWWYPQRLDGVQADDEFFVYADVPAQTPVRVTLNGAPVPAGELRSVAKPLLERAWVQAKIASLFAKQSEGGDPRGDLKKQIVDLSVQNRVLSPYTALLVLETEDDYARFNIDRRALCDILTVDGPRIARTHRATATFVASSPAKNEEKEDSLPATARPGPPAPPGTRPRAPLQMDFDGAPASATRSAMGGSSAPAPVNARPGDPLAGNWNAPPPPPSPARARPSPEPMAPPMATASASAAPRAVRVESSQIRIREDDAKKKEVEPYTGRFKSVMDAIAHGDAKTALSMANDWHKEDPGDVMALVALGEAFEANGDLVNAARAYGSLVDLFSSRADLRRFAGERLERLKDGAGMALALDTYEKAAAERPDHPSSHRLLTYAWLKRGYFSKAFDAAAAGLKQKYAEERFPGVIRILKEDLGLVGAAWSKAEPNRRAEILARVRADGGTVEDQPSLRFVLNWETDANDVDFHIIDAEGNHAFYSEPKLASGGELYADVTTGYGPECFTIRGARRAGPYTLQAHYYSRGPMGYGMGKLEIIDHDGKGNLTFEERPYVVMVDQAFVQLGKVEK